MIVDCNEGPTLFKPAYHNLENEIACKIVSVRNENAKINKSSVLGIILLFDSKTGETLSMMDAALLTGEKKIKINKKKKKIKKKKIIKKKIK